MNRVRLGCLVAVVAGLAIVPATPSGAESVASTHLPVVRAGAARFEVLSPTLIRLEYAPGGRFEDRPTMVAQDRHPISRFTTSRSHGVLTIRTSALELSYRIGGPFTSKNVTLRSRHGAWTVHPGWSAAAARGNLGGWIRALDNRQGPVPLHQGLLTRAGWYLLNDSSDALLTSQAPGFAVRDTPAGYQDG